MLCLCGLPGGEGECIYKAINRSDWTYCKGAGAALTDRGVAGKIFKEERYQ